MVGFSLQIWMWKRTNFKKTVLETGKSSRSSCQKTREEEDPNQEVGNENGWEWGWPRSIEEVKLTEHGDWSQCERGQTIKDSCQVFSLGDLMVVETLTGVGSTGENWWVQFGEPVDWTHNPETGRRGTWQCEIAVVTQRYCDHLTSGGLSIECWKKLNT